MQQSWAKGVPISICHVARRVVLPGFGEGVNLLQEVEAFPSLVLVTFISKVITNIMRKKEEVRFHAGRAISTIILLICKLISLNKRLLCLIRNKYYKSKWRTDKIPTYTTSL